MVLFRGQISQPAQKMITFDQILTGSIVEA